MRPELNIFKSDQYRARCEARFSERVEQHFWEPIRELFRDLDSLGSEAFLDIGSIISVGRRASLSSEELEKLKILVERLSPWRKGPYQLFGIDIDAEWRSDLKWERVKDALVGIEGERVCDVGSNNGYYMFKMLEYKPSLVVGLDPSVRCFYQFQLLQHFAKRAELVQEPFGIEDLDVYPKFFDTIVCMGVIYHRRDPLASLQLLKEALRPGGRLLLESVTIDGQDPYALCPSKRYSKMPNVWFIPTETCLETWLRRSGFKDIELVSSSVTTIEEQRQTDLAPFESLEDYLDPNDLNKTVEGYPAPRRSAFICKRPD